MIKQYDEVRKVSTGYGDDYTAGCFLDYAYFKDNYRLIAVDLSKQKALDDDPRATEQTVFQGVVGGEKGTKIRPYTILEQSKETVLEFAKGTTKVLQTIYNWLNTTKWILNYQMHRWKNWKLPSKKNRNNFKDEF